VLFPGTHPMVAREQVRIDGAGSHTLTACPNNLPDGQSGLAKSNASELGNKHSRQVEQESPRDPSNFISRRHSTIARVVSFL